jgi:DNA-dependent protein kinase catalytic subunit
MCNIFSKGDIISIDYGMAFGTATNQLAVPEVVPCRLTTQFQYLIPGLGLNGPIRESMIHTLRVIKEESGSIIAALSIFVTEPTLDWLKRAEKMATRSRTEASNNESTDWSPVEVIQRTENLLNGSHPSKITCDDLKRNTIFSTAEGRKLLPVLVSVVQGTSDPSTVAGSSDTIVNKRRIECYPSRRASMPKQELSSDQQVGDFSYLFLNTVTI